MQTEQWQKIICSSCVPAYIQKYNMFMTMHQYTLIIVLFYLKPYMYVRCIICQCVLSCNLPPALLAEWPGSFCNLTTCLTLLSVIVHVLSSCLAMIAWQRDMVVDKMVYVASTARPIVVCTTDNRISQARDAVCVMIHSHTTFSP